MYMYRQCLFNVAGAVNIDTHPLYHGQYRYRYTIGFHIVTKNDVWVGGGRVSVCVCECVCVCVVCV